MKIHRDCLVGFEYELRAAAPPSPEDPREPRPLEELAEELAEDGPVTYVHGYGTIPAGLERTLEGLETGAETEISLDPEEAYGPYNPDGLIGVPRDEFPDDAEIVPGDWITVSLSEDDEDEPLGEMEMRVHEIRPEAIVLDANHPLAGRRVTFHLRVLDVRAATPDEVAEARREAAEAAEAEDDDR